MKIEPGCISLFKQHGRGMATRDWSGRTEGASGSEQKTLQVLSSGSVY